MENQEQDWNILNKNLTILSNPASRKHQQAVKELLDTFYESKTSMVDNPDLDFMDVYDAYVAILLATHQQALKEEYYEVIPLIDKCYVTQYNIMMGYIVNELCKADKELYKGLLEASDDYYNQTKLQTIKKK